MALRAHRRMPRSSKARDHGINPRFAFYMRKTCVPAGWPAAPAGAAGGQLMSDTPGEPAQDRDRRHAAVNLLSLTAVQVANAVVPLLIYPYLLLTLGPDGYANIVMAEAAALFLLMFVLYSFEIDGVAAVVPYRHSREAQALSRIFCEIITARCLFFAAGLIVLVAIVHVTRPSLTPLVLGWTLVSLSFALQPNWLFQGLEWNLPFAMTTLISRAGAVVTIFLTVKGPSDAGIVPVQIGLWYVAGSVAAAAFAVRALKLSWRSPRLSDIGRLAWNGKEIFFGNFGVGLYRDINVLLLGAFGAPSGATAAYSIAEKLVKAVQAVIRPLNQFFLPRVLAVTQLTSVPNAEAFKRIGAMTLPQIGVLAIVIAALGTGFWFFADRISFVSKIENLNLVISLLSIMVCAAFPGLANFMFGSAGLNGLGARRYFLMAILAVGFASIVLNVVLIPIVGVYGSAAAFVLSEAGLLALIMLRYFQSGPKPSDRAKR